MPARLSYPAWCVPDSFGAHFVVFIPAKLDAMKTPLPTHPLRSAPDLNPLLHAIGDARIVLLGEASHGTSEYYTWRTEISRRLILEKGFQFIAVEGDWPDCFTVNAAIKQNEVTYGSAARLLSTFERWPTWMWGNWEIAALIEWLHQHNRPLPPERRVGFYGLDVYSLWESLQEIMRYVQRQGDGAVQAAHRAFQCFEPYSAVPVLIASLLSLLPAWHGARAAGVVFRYLPDRGALSSEVVATGIETGPFLDPRELPARGPGGWGLQAPPAAEFEAPGSTLRSVETAAISQTFGPRLTAEVWLQPTTTSGRIPLLGNRISGAGNFELGLDEGTPYFLVTAGGQDVRVDGPASVAAGASVWVAATAEFDVPTQTLRLALYQDGRLTATSATPLQVPSPYVIARPFFVGTEATGTAASYTLAGRLSGQLLGAVVRDYVAAEDYLTSSVPDDGSAYFGLPDYHDYGLSSSEQPMDLRIRSNPSEVQRRFFVPYVNDEFVPQGTATHVETTDGAATPLVYLSYYHLTRSGLTGQRRSLITEIDAETGHVRRTFRLMGTLGFSHAGGIAYAQGAIYVSSSSTLERYPLPPYDPDGPRYFDLEADPAGTISVYGRASFVSAHRDTLWVGDWRTNSHEAPYLYGYPLAEDGRPVSGATPTVYALPRSVQGVDMFEVGGQTYVFFSRNRSLSRGEAEILRVRREALARWVEPAIDSTITVPYGIEDLSFFPDGSLWTNSESSADYYQRSSSGAWGVFYPFVYSLPAEAVFGEALATDRAEGPHGRPAGLEMTAAPNPFRDRTTLTVDVAADAQARIRVTDALGRHVATLLDGPVAAGTTTVSWDSTAQAAGLYFVTLEANGERTTRLITLAR